MKKMKPVLFTAIFFLCSAAQDISGFWKTISEKTGKAESVVAVYEYKGLYYGRIIGSYNENGVMNDTIYHPIDKAPGVVGEPYYSGLDIIWNLRNRGDKFKGKIMDPQEGKVYNAELWVEEEDLIVRGKVFIFGRSQTWPRATDKDFPPGFKKPDLSTLVPNIREVK